VLKNGHLILEHTSQYNPPLTLKRKKDLKAKGEYKKRGFPVTVFLFSHLCLFVNGHEGFKTIFSKDMIAFP
jgi:hypothetical protein